MSDEQVAVDILFSLVLNRVTDCLIFKELLGGFEFSIASSLLFYVETKPSLFFLFDSTIIHSSDVCVSSL